MEEILFYVKREDSVRLKLAMRLALEYLRMTPKEQQDGYLIGPNREKITYLDAVGVVQDMLDAI